MDGTGAAIEHVDKKVLAKSLWRLPLALANIAPKDAAVPSVVELTKYLTGMHKNYEVMGTENLPAAGPVCLLPTHYALFDPFQVGIAAYCSTGRITSFMMRDDFFGMFGPYLNSIFEKYLDAVIFRRNTSTRTQAEGAMGKAQADLAARLDQGNAIAFYPQGTRSRTGDPFELYIRDKERGYPDEGRRIRMMALRTQNFLSQIDHRTTLVPTWISCMDDKGQVVFGKPSEYEKAGRKHDIKLLEELIREQPRLQQIGMEQVVAGYFHEYEKRRQRHDGTIPKESIYQSGIKVSVAIADILKAYEELGSEGLNMKPVPEQSLKEKVELQLQDYKRRGVLTVPRGEMVTLKLDTERPMPQPSRLKKEMPDLYLYNQAKAIPEFAEAYDPVFPRQFIPQILPAGSR